VQFLSYINPYVASDKDLCEEAAKRGYLTKMHGGTTTSSLASSTALST
jgi:alpha-glucosidase